MIVSRYSEGITHDAGPPNGRNHVICGFLSCDRLPFLPLLAALPRMLHLPESSAGSGTYLTRQLIRSATLAAEQGDFGAAALLERAREAMFIDALLRYLDSLPDPHIGRALALIHRSPARPWGVDDLAQAAASLLRESRLPVAAVALDVGYDSEAAFARAFKRMVGTSPARWRRLQQTS